MHQGEHPGVTYCLQTMPSHRAALIVGFLRTTFQVVKNTFRVTQAFSLVSFAIQFRGLNGCPQNAVQFLPAPRRGSHLTLPITDAADDPDERESVFGANAMSGRPDDPRRSCGQSRAEGWPRVWTVMGFPRRLTRFRRSRWSSSQFS